MYCPKAFAVDDPGVLARFIAAHTLATLVTHGPDGLHATLLPMFLETSAGGDRVLHGHLARANPQWKDGDVDALALFRAESHYISPGWYASKAEHGRVVPTYDYIAVEARGRVRFMHDVADLRAIVGRLTAEHEAAVGGAWSISDAPEAYIEANLRAIVGVELRVDHLVGAFKLSQNQSTENLAGVVAGLQALGTAGSSSIAELIAAAQPAR